MTSLGVEFVDCDILFFRSLLADPFRIITEVFVRVASRSALDLDYHADR